jgi:hypothetical protein
MLKQEKYPRIEVFKIIEFIWRPSYKDEHLLHQKYVVERLSASEIAFENSSSTSTVLKFLRLAKIPIRPADKKTRRRLSYGEAWKDGRVVPHEREPGNIEKMRQLRVRGFSYWEIADILKGMNISTKTRKGKWHARYVQKLIERK